MRKAGVDSQPVEKGSSRACSFPPQVSMRCATVFTSALVNAGVAPELRMKLTGHTTEAAHRGYTHLEMESLRAAIGKLPTIAQR